jgi:hypothetical protein
MEEKEPTAAPWAFGGEIEPVPKKKGAGGILWGSAGVFDRGRV